MSASVPSPPPELVDQWVDMLGHRSDHEVFAAAARWGADRELEACVEYLVRCAQWEPEDVAEFLATRQPKPPSLKEQALKAALIELDPTGKNGSLIFRALEALPDD